MRAARLLALILFAGLVAIYAPEHVAAAGFTVNSTADSPDVIVGDGICGGGGQCTLRAALEESKAQAGHDSISFNIPAATDPGCDSGTGICSIVTDIELPFVSDVTIDGYTQPGASPNTNGPGLGSNAQLKIELRSMHGNYPNYLTYGLSIGSNSTVRGLWISHAYTNIRGGNSNVIAGNFIGFGPGAVVPNDSYYGLSLGSDNTVGGTDPADRNVIADSSRGVFFSGAGNTVKGNLIGTNPAGTQRLGSATFGLYLCTGDNVIGGSANGAGNVISGAWSANIYVTSCEHWENFPSNITIQGNLIGTSVDGLSPIYPDNGIGVRIGGSRAGGPIDIGGAAAGEGNLIAFNGDSGLTITDSSPSIVTVTVRGNSVHSNGGPGISTYSSYSIDLFTPPPEILSITPLSGGNYNVTGSSCDGCIVDVFSDSQNEGRSYHGSAVTFTNGIWQLNAQLQGPVITATATTPAGSTSRFSTGFPIDGSADEDADGFSHDTEVLLGTDPANGCADTSTANDEDPDPYPPDFDDNRRVDVSDVLALKPVFGGNSTRHDLAPSGGTITISDVLAMKPLFRNGCLFGAG